MMPGPEIEGHGRHVHLDGRLELCDPLTHCDAAAIRVCSNAGMKLRLAILITAALGALLGQPVPVIFDTDIMGDVDDVGAVATLHALAASGEAEILAMGVSAKHPACVPALSVLNDYYGRPDIPVGVVKGYGFLRDTRYADKIANEFPHSIASADDVPDAALMYRRVLAGQPDGSVVMISVGQLTNFRNLLFSPPDEFSPLRGRELVARKVKLWSCMGARLPSGREANLIHDGPAAQQAIDYWPTPIVFSPWGIGRAVQTGGRLGELPESSPVRRAYELFKDGIKPHNSYDQTSVLFAVRGARDWWHVRSQGHLRVRLDGENEWRSEPDRDHSYLEEKAPPEEVARVIEELMLYEPRKDRLAAGIARILVLAREAAGESDGGERRWHGSSGGESSLGRGPWELRAGNRGGGAAGDGDGVHASAVEEGAPFWRQAAPDIAAGGEGREGRQHDRSGGVEEEAEAAAHAGSFAQSDRGMEVSHHESSVPPFR